MPKWQRRAMFVDAGAKILQLVKTFMLGVIEYVRCH